MDRHFDDEIIELKRKLLEMAETALSMLRLSVSALVCQDPKEVAEVFKRENIVNSLEIWIEEEVLRLLALRQPAARDLRLLTAVLKIVNDLERVADQSYNIAEIAQSLAAAPDFEAAGVDIQSMALDVEKMIRHGIHAFIHHDATLARTVCASDDRVDQANRQIFGALLTHMMENPASLRRSLQIILVSRNLERVADHATNIAEEVIFIEEGRSVKHLF